MKVKSNNIHNRTNKGVRASGDILNYFILHNIISVIWFFGFTVGFDIYRPHNISFWLLFTAEFWTLVIFQIFPIFIVSGVIGRVTAYGLIKAYYWYENRKRTINRAVKGWSELNEGINKMGIRFIITALITSFIYSFGIMTILQYVIFNEDTILGFIIIYIGVKIGVFFLVRYLVSAKL